MRGRWVKGAHTCDGPAKMDFQLIGLYLTRAQPARPLSKARASEWETGSTFCSRGQDRQSAHRLSVGGWLATTARSFARIPVTALRHGSTLSTTCPWQDGPPHALA